MPWRIFHLFHGIYILYHGLSLLDEFVKVIGIQPEAKVLEPKRHCVVSGKATMRFSSTSGDLEKNVPMFYPKRLHEIFLKSD